MLPEHDRCDPKSLEAAHDVLLAQNDDYRMLPVAGRLITEIFDAVKLPLSLALRASDWLDGVARRR